MPRPTRYFEGPVLSPTISPEQVNSPLTSQPAMADSLTNIGTVGQAPPMNLPGIVELQPETFVQGPTPPVMQGLAEYDEFEDEPETDGFLFNDENIYENSGFLGIAIGKKAKARVKARKAKRIEKRTARKQSRNQALADAQAALTAARMPTETAQPLPVPDPMLPAAPILPDSTSYMPAMPTMYNPVDMSLQNDDDLFDETPLNPQAYASPAAYQHAVQAQKKKKQSKMFLYAGIGAAVLIIIVLILKK